VLLLLVIVILLDFTEFLLFGVQGTEDQSGVLAIEVV
jgi:hypothetical protein